MIPQPSDDVNDPLNWPAWKKSLAFSTILVFTALVTWVIGGLGTAIISTPQGLMTGRKAYQLGLGGEVVCFIW